MQKLVDGRSVISDFIFLSKYARTVNGRKETWEEAVTRVMTMHWLQLEKVLKGDAKKLEEIRPYFDKAYQFYNNKVVVGAQRGLQYGGEQLEKHNLRLYNCTSSYADRTDFFKELYYALLAGAGCGYSVLPIHTSKMPKVEGIASSTVIHNIADSIEGWAGAAGALVNAHFYNQPKPIFDYSGVRKKGSFISGGFKAPGPDPLRICLEKLDRLLSNASGRHLTAFEIHRIACIIADSVISGGIRRSALIVLFDPRDTEMLNSKTGNWFVKYPELARANNTAVILPDTLKDLYLSLFKATKEFGEPGIAFIKDPMFTYNPCFEVGMYPTMKDDPQITGQTSGWSLCNLTEINGGKIKTKEDFLQAAEAAAILGTFQATYTELGLLGPISEMIVKRDALIGVGITGMAESPDILFNEEYQKQAAGVVVETNKKLAKILGINPAARTTVIKPSGNSSQLLGTASGIHPFAFTKYIRHIQVTDDEQAANLYADHNPQASAKSRYSGNVLMFPVSIPDKSLVQEDLSAVEFLDLVKKTQMNWVEYGTNRDHPSYKKNPSLRHNVSNTCFSEDTRFLTGGGLKSFKDFVDGDSVQVFDLNGDLQTGIVKNFGRQKLYRLVLTSNKVDREIFTTREHIWLIMDELNSLLRKQDKKPGVRKSLHYRYKMVRTEDLLSYRDSLIPKIYPKSINHTIDKRAFCHGYVFGDGSKNYTREENKTFVYIYDSCREDIATLFQEVYPGVNIIRREDHIRIYALDPRWKELPNSEQHTPEYLYSFISGWFAADGYVANTKTGQRAITLSNKYRENLEWLQRVAPIAGIGVNSILVHVVKVGFKPGETYYNISFVANTLSDNFFINHSNKLQNWLSRKGKTQSNKYYHVKSLELTEREEDVWCVYQPENSTFLLEGNILTHNCRVAGDQEWETVAEYLWANKEEFCGVSLLGATGDLDYPQAPFTSYLDEYELVDEYGVAAILAGGLNIDGLEAFGDIWIACDTALGKGEKVELTPDTITSSFKSGLSQTASGEYIFKKSVDGLMITDTNAVIQLLQDSVNKKIDWIRRFKKFAKNYFQGDTQKAARCLKHVSIFHKWQKLAKYKSVDWNEVDWHDELVDAGDGIASGCAGGKCEI